MRRLFINEPIGEKIIITGPDAHHLGYSLRGRVGQRYVVADVNGEVAEMEIVSFTTDTVTLRLIEKLAADTESPVELILAMCLPKSDKMEFIVQKATELGATSVQPLKSDNCVVKYDDKKSLSRQEKWQKIADEAGKQCARTVIPTVEPIKNIADWFKDIKQVGDSIKMMCYEAEDRKSVGDFLAEANGEKYILLIGPEGGFSLSEVEQAVNAGFTSVSLGKRILKAETAAVAAMTVVQYEKGDLGRRGMA